MNVANELRNGFTNELCIDKWRKVILNGKVSNDEAEYMDAAYTPDTGYIYDDDVEVVFKIEIKKVKREVVFNGMICSSLLYEHSLLQQPSIFEVLQRGERMCVRRVV